MPKISALIVFLITVFIAEASNRWHVSFTPGISLVPPVPLVIRQENHESIRLWANYRSAPLKLPPYYSGRLGFMENGRGWEAELNHLKVYLKNRPEEAERFSISHGYNQIFINRIIEKGRFSQKIGLGMVAAHPENKVRGKLLDEKKGLFGDGYYLTGPAIQYGLYKEIPLGRHFFLLGEARISAAFARVPVADGKADAPVVAIHLQLGPGFRL
jgi:hypothetical protein